MANLMFSFPAGAAGEGAGRRTQEHQYRLPKRALAQKWLIRVASI